jgi:hypothetical protein
MEMKQMADERRGATEGSLRYYKFRDGGDSEEAKGRNSRLSSLRSPGTNEI